VSKAITLVRPRTVTGEGVGLVSHAGLVSLGEVADPSGLTAGLAAASPASSPSSVFGMQRSCHLRARSRGQPGVVRATPG
jgi:hypothetical protein